MAGNRKHGFLRGNAKGRNGSNTPAPWHCAGCGRQHGGRVTRTGLAGMAWLVGAWLRSTGRGAPRDVRMSRGYAVRVGDMLVSVADAAALFRIQ